MIKIKVFRSGGFVEALEEQVNRFLEDYHYELVSFQWQENVDEVPILIISYKEE